MRAALIDEPHPTNWSISLLSPTYTISWGRLSCIFQDLKVPLPLFLHIDKSLTVCEIPGGKRGIPPYLAPQCYAEVLHRLNTQYARFHGSKPRQSNRLYTLCTYTRLISLTVWSFTQLLNHAVCPATETIHAQNILQCYCYRILPAFLSKHPVGHFC